MDFIILNNISISIYIGISHTHIRRVGRYYDELITIYKGSYLYMAIRLRDQASTVFPGH